MQIPEQRANYRHKVKLRDRRGLRNTIQWTHDKQIRNQANQPHRTDVQNGVIKRLGIVTHEGEQGAK